MENLYENKNIKADCNMMKEHVDSYNQPDESFSQKCSMNFTFLVCRLTWGEGDVQQVRP